MANLNKRKIIIRVLDVLVISLALYLMLLPILPEIKYRIFELFKNDDSFEDVETVESLDVNTKRILAGLPTADFQESPERIIIDKIGVNAPIVESSDPDEGLSRGAWRDPSGSTPGSAGNTIITGHRFKYLPPSNLTFYLLHKLEVNDKFSIVWKGELYHYVVREKKIVAPTELDILEQAEKSIVTIYTCDPIYSQKNRLVIVGELMKEF